MSPFAIRTALSRPARLTGSLRDDKSSRTGVGGGDGSGASAGDVDAGAARGSGGAEGGAAPMAPTIAISTRSGMMSPLAVPALGRMAGQT